MLWSPLGGVRPPRLETRIIPYHWFPLVACSLLYLEVEVMSSQWMVSLLRSPPQTFPSYNNPKPQPACFYYYIPSMPSNHRAREKESRTGWWKHQNVQEPVQPSDIGQFSQTLQAILPVIPSMYYWPGEQKWWIKMAEWYDLWKSSEARRSSQWVSEQASQLLMGFVCLPEPSNNSPKCFPSPPIPRALPKQQRHHDFAFNDNERKTH